MKKLLQRLFGAKKPACIKHNVGGRSEQLIFKKHFKAVLNETQKIEGATIPKQNGEVYLLFNATEKGDWGYRNKEWLPQEGIDYGNYTHHWKYPSGYVKEFVALD